MQGPEGAALASFTGRGPRAGDRPGRFPRVSQYPIRDRLAGRHGLSASAHRSGTIDRRPRGRSRRPSHREQASSGVGVPVSSSSFLARPLDGASLPTSRSTPGTRGSIRCSTPDARTSSRSPNADRSPALGRVGPGSRSRSVQYFVPPRPLSFDSLVGRFSGDRRSFDTAGTLGRGVDVGRGVWRW